MADDQYQLEGNAPRLFERDNAGPLGKPLAEQVFGHVELRAGDRVLDAACGTGIVTRVAAQRFPHVGKLVGVDRNVGMLEVAREHAPTNVPVEWKEGDLGALPFPDGSFEVVLCQNGLQFVPDKPRALREMCRVLVPGGRLAFTVWSEVTAYGAALSEALARHISAAAAASNQSMFQLRDARTVRDLVEAAGFRDVVMQELIVLRPMPASAEGIVADTARTAFARDVAAASEAARQALGREVSAALRGYRDGDKLTIPHKSHLVRARAAWSG
jgi:ubiquinone/menaquinone biosynthesis C-methylase UbiE